MERAADTIAPPCATERARAGVPTDELRRRLKRRAQELGLADLGVTTADPLPHEDFLERWLAEGRDGEMEYLRREKRARPDALLPGARTLIVAAASYAQAAEEPAPLAAYAQRDDYHLVMKRALRVLSAELRAAVPGTLTRVCVDTAPILEREAAMRAGVGWIGKNTMLVHAQHGCYTLLGEILWTGELEPDPPAVDHCGECRRCLDACPTGALDQPWQMDARRCISYLTIEQRGAIPLELREFVGARAFGCDACLAACPFGGRTLRNESELLPTSAHLATKSLRELLELARVRFWKTFRHTPVERARRRGMLRNLLVAAGNARDRALLDIVTLFCSDADALIAEHARWARARIVSETSS